MNENIISAFLSDYEKAPNAKTLQGVAQAGAQFGFLLNGLTPVPSRVQSYNIAELLLPGVHDAADIHMGVSLTPEWIDFSKEYLSYDERALVSSFVAAYDVRKQRGKWFFGEQQKTPDEVKKALSASLALVCARVGSVIYSAYGSLCATVHDEESGRMETITFPIFAEEMKAAGLSVRLNAISREIEIDGAPSFEDTAVDMWDALKTKYKGVSLDVVSVYLAKLARQNEYNPVLDVLEKTVWDGVDRFPQLFELMGLADVMSRVLVRKWFNQTIALLYNDPADPFGADGCLVLQGPQGTGKTSLLRHIAMRPNWFIEGAVINDGDKDTRRRVVTRWVAELGEVESTFRKADTAALKAFITQQVDAYRLPYGRSDVKTPRRTSLCASCNEPEFLVDATGNRRFWTVRFRGTPLPRADLEALDALQLWAQVYATISGLTYQEKKECFRLTGDEQRQLAERNSAFEAPIKAQRELEDILSREGLLLSHQTITEFRTAWQAELGRYSVNQIGVALRRIGVPMDRKRVNGVLGRYSLLPTPQRAGWPG